ncbi:MAG: hypothetical protein ACI83P_000638 [Janthinobacterium sp.]|jgi:uncharacterized protein YdcH (DUF465 family)
MQVEHHPLSVEFPKFTQQIQALKADDMHFSKLYDAYGDVDKVITRAENGLDHLGDAALENLKKKRIVLKDQLFELLNGAA